MSEATHTHPLPSERACRLVVSAIDLHVHTAPDVMRRRITDIDLARKHREAGLGGFVLKSHYVPTAERAATVRQAVPGVAVYGGIVLNGSVGGMNPLAVEIAAREGARVVWMPTVDSRNQRTFTAAGAAGADGADGAAGADGTDGVGATDAADGTDGADGYSGVTPPMWAKVQDELIARGIAAPPIEVTDAGGEVLPEVRDVVRLVAQHDLVLATGHLSRDEIFAVVRAANDEGVRRIVVTHPEFSSQRLSGADQRELAERGAYLERCFTTPYTGEVAWAEMVANIRAAGPAHSFVSTDLGQPFNPPVEDGLALMADHLLGAGFSDDEVHLMIVVNPVTIIT